jgi:hypothetical protein
MGLHLFPEIHAFYCGGKLASDDVKRRLCPARGGGKLTRHLGGPWADPSEQTTFAVVPRCAWNSILPCKDRITRQSDPLRRLRGNDPTQRSVALSDHADLAEETSETSTTVPATPLDLCRDYIVRMEPDQAFHPKEAHALVDSLRPDIPLHLRPLCLTKKILPIIRFGLILVIDAREVGGDR